MPWRGGSDCHRSNCSAGGGKRGSLRIRTLRQHRCLCRRLWKGSWRSAWLAPRARKQPRQANLSGIIEVEIDGVTIRVGRGADAKTVTAVIRVLKAGA